MATDTGTTGEAAAKVLYNFELLENILTHGAATNPKTCDHDYHAERLRDLYRFQGINSTFRDVIARSKALRTIMFKTESLKDSSRFNINPLVNRLEWFGAPLEISRFAWIEEKPGGSKMLHGRVTDLTDKPTERLAVDFIHQSKGLAWRQMLLVDKATPFSVDIEVVVGEASDSCILDFREYDRLGGFADLVLDVIIETRRHRLGQRLKNSSVEPSEDDSDAD